MQTSYAHKKSISITLDLEVYDDFDYKSIDFNSLLELEGDETLEVSITDKSEVDVFWIHYNCNPWLIVIINEALCANRWTVH